MSWENKKDQLALGFMVVGGGGWGNNSPQAWARLMLYELLYVAKGGNN